MKKLKEWAAENEVKYTTAYAWYKNGKLPIKAEKNAGGSIMVFDDPEEPKIASLIADSKAIRPIDQTNGQESTLPRMAVYQEARASSPTRSNRAANIAPVNRFQNIEDGIIPFTNNSGANYGGSSASFVNVTEMVILCQKAYYNFAIVRNVIDLMTDFSVAKIFLTGSTKTARDFFMALFKKINLDDFQQMFFCEYYRSGNVFIHRFDGSVKPADVNKITQVFGEDRKPLQIKAGNKVKLPLKYIILNPADVQLMHAASFVTGIYYKFLSPFEIQALRNPQTEEDREIFDNLDAATKKLISSKTTTGVLIKLDTDKLVTLFYKKQSYEPFAISLIYPILELINFKAEMLKMDQALMRTTQQAILLITMGNEPDKGGINQANLIAMQSLFENQSVGRVLIADYTTKGQFLIPQIADIMDPKKYQIVNEDIQNGLNNILMGSAEKFANQSIKVQIFVERLKKSREAFLNNFLMPEIKRISKELGFKTFPNAKFEDINLRDDVEFSRIITRLAEIGILTAEETLTAFETGRIPTSEESLESQQTFKEQKDKGMYLPVAGGPYSQLKVAKLMADTQAENAKLTADTALKKQAMMPKVSGRPAGSSGPQKKKTVRPIGASEEKYSLKKVTDNMILATKLSDNISNKLLKKHKLKQLNEQQLDTVKSLTELIMANEPSEKWIESSAAYLKNPVDKNLERVDELNNIAYEHQLENYLACVLLNSKI